MVWNFGSAASKKMPTSGEYQFYAQECVRWADQSGDEADRRRPNRHRHFTRAGAALRFRQRLYSAYKTPIFLLGHAVGIAGHTFDESLRAFIRSPSYCRQKAKHSNIPLTTPTSPTNVKRRNTNFVVHRDFLRPASLQPKYAALRL